MANPTLSNDVNLKALVDKLQAENEALKAKANGKPSQFTLKIGESGGISAYGLGRFPVTLYQEQWARLLDQADTIRAFIKASQGDPRLKVKDQARAPEVEAAAAASREAKAAKATMIRKAS